MADPDVVMLIHGTWAYSSTDAPKAGDDATAAWWQVGSAFELSLQESLGDVATCWPKIEGFEFPWESKGWKSWFSNRVLQGRKRFAWSGRNSDHDRREAGRRLLQGIERLELARRDYHLIGHSHGGTVIWHALTLAASKNIDLPHLRSWSTMGTPFPTSWVPSPIFSCVGAFLSGIAISRRLSTYALNVDLLFSVLLLALGYSLWRLSIWVNRRGQKHREDRNVHQAWSRFRRRWLAIFSIDDETMAATYLSIDFYPKGLVRISPPSGISRLTAIHRILFSLPWNICVAPAIDVLINTALRSKWRSDDRTGVSISYFSPFPVYLPVANRITPPDVVSEELIVKTAERFSSTAKHTFETIGSRAIESEENRSQSQLTALLAGLDFAGVTPHISYYETPVIKKAIAYKIALTSARADSELKNLVRQEIPDEVATWVEQDFASGDFKTLPPNYDDAECQSPYPRRRQPSRLRLIDCLPIIGLLAIAFAGIVVLIVVILVIMFGGI